MYQKGKGDIELSPYLDEKKGKWYPSTFESIEEGNSIIIPNTIEAIELGDKEWDIREYDKPLKYTIIRQLDAGAQGSVYVVELDKKEYILKQMDPCVYKDGEYTGSCVTDSIGFSVWKNTLNVLPEEDLEPYYKARDDYEAKRLPKKVCDDMFTRELAYSTLFGHLGISPRVMGFKLENYSIVMEKLEKTLGEVVKSQPNRTLSKEQWKQLFQIQRTLLEQGVNHNDQKQNNYMVDKKGKIYIIDWGAANVINKKNSVRYFPSGIYQLGSLLPSSLRTKRGLTWTDVEKEILG